VLVVGFGNPLRADDGIGVRAVEALLACALPAGVEVLEGGAGGPDLVNLLDGRQRAILVDAALLGRRPGEFLRLALEELHLQSDNGPVSMHAAGLRDGLRLAQALELLPPDVVIYAMQPECLEWRSGLSREVEAALPGMVAEVLAEIGR
jgi:hydrogenase maturation protease